MAMWALPLFAANGSCGTPAVHARCATNAVRHAPPDQAARWARRREPPGEVASRVRNHEASRATVVRTEITLDARTTGGGPSTYFGQGPAKRVRIVDSLDDPCGFDTHAFHEDGVIRKLCLRRHLVNVVEHTDVTRDNDGVEGDGGTHDG